VPAERSTVSGVAPGAAPLRVLHVSGRAAAPEAQRLAAYEQGLGWQVTLARVGSPRGLAGQLRRSDVDVVALHGRTAGLIGRLLLRGSRCTVLVPRAGTWCAGGLLARIWERQAAAWTNAVLLTDPVDAARGVRRRVWVPPFVVGDSLELQAAVLTRAQAFGRTSARLAARSS
jgi:hypothetical protein